MGPGDRVTRTGPSRVYGDEAWQEGTVTLATEAWVVVQWDDGPSRYERENELATLERV